MINKKQLIGGLNTDDAEVLLAPNEYLGALNIRFVTSENGSVGRITNIEGNTLKTTTIDAGGASAPFSLPSGTNTVVGSKEDLANNRLFFFVKNSNSKHGIFCYDSIADVIFTVVTNNKPVPDIVGGLSFSSYIHSIDVLGSLLCWTEGDTDARMINADAAINANHPTHAADYTYTFPIAYESSTVIKRPPVQALTVSKQKSAGATSTSTNYIKGNSFKFLYQYNYKDAQLSALSAHSAIMPYANSTSAYDYITVKIPFTEKIPDDVSTIDIAVRINDETNCSIIKTFDRSVDDFASHNSGTTQLSYDFYNNTIGVTLDTIQSGTSFHSVPQKSQTLTFAKNRLFLANNTSGYKTPTSSSLSITTSNFTPTVSSTITAAWKYVLMSKTDARGAMRGYASIYYAYDSTGTTAKVYFFESSKSSATPPSSFSITDATTTATNEANFISWYQGHYSAGTGLEWNFGGTINTTSYTTSLNVPSDQLDGIAFFKTGSTYKTSIAFYDRFRRKCGVVDLNNNNKLIPFRTFNQTSFISSLNWTLSNTSAVSEIPDWAYYYQIHVTKSLLTRFFIQDYTGGVYYTTKSSTGTFTHAAGSYSSTIYAVSIDLSRLNAGGRGYTYQEGDLVRLTRNDDAPFTLQVLGVDGKYLMLSGADVGAVTSTTEMLFELYTPYLPSATEPYYETGPVMSVVSPGTTSRSYSVLSGSISGDVYPKAALYGTSTYTIETMNPNFTYWQDWQTNTGWVNIVTKLGTTVKKNSIQFSDPVIPGTLINGLNSFQALNESELPIELNGIQRILLTNKVQVEGTVMLAIGKNETTSIYLGESQIFDATGDSIIAKTTGVIGQMNTLRGSYGTVNPESAFGWQGSVYWFDANKGSVVRYDNTGLFPISDSKMRKYFIKLGELVLKTGVQVLMGIDPYHEEVYLTVPQTNIVPTNTTLPDMVLATSSYNFTTAAASISVSPSTLSGFTYQLGSGPSSSSSFTYNGVNLPINGTVTVTGSTNFEVSLDGTTFKNSVTIPYVGSASSSTVFVRLKTGLSVGSYTSQTITVAASGVSNTVSVSGSVTAIPASVLIASVDTLSGFTYALGSGPSTAQSFTISASGLSPASGNATISVDGNYEISTTSSTSGFGIGSLTLAYTAAGLFANNTIWVRLKSGLTAGGGTSATYNNTITISGGGGSDTVGLTGTVTSSSAPTYYAFPSSGYGSSVNNSVTMANAGTNTLWSDTATIGIGSHIYISHTGTPLTGYGYVYIDGAAWKYNPSTGLIFEFIIPQP